MGERLINGIYLLPTLLFAEYIKTIDFRDRLNGKNYETVQAALADCQEAAIQVGEDIMTKIRTAVSIRVLHILLYAKIK